MLGPKIQQRPLAGEPQGWPQGTHAVLQRVYAARGVLGPTAADHRLRNLIDPGLLPGVASAASMIADAITDQIKIAIVGDFDADGATGCAVGVRGLRLLGAADIAFHVPNRMVHGYGLTPELVSVIACGNKPDLLITVDNGIACHAGVAAARAAGMRVIITDHHLPGPSLPDADAIVNPNLAQSHFPSGALSGVGTMFYVLLAVRARLREMSWFDSARAEPDLGCLLDLVALGTVADMVPLDFNNRILVEAGLRRIRNGQASPGMQALLEIGKKRPASAQAADLAFAVAPRVNAAGRLEDMGIGIACLLAECPMRAMQMAAQLDGINKQRQELQADMVEHADLILEKHAAEHGGIPAGICLYDEGWHVGIVGLVASKIKERTHRPAIAFAATPEKADELRGSARSIDGINIRDTLADIARDNPDLIPRFGGHAMAAGLCIAKSDLARFSRLFEQRVARESDARGENVLWSDGALSAQELEFGLAMQLRDAGPWGQGFPEPCFDNVFDLVKTEVFAEKHLKLHLSLRGGRAIEGVYFNGLGKCAKTARIRALYQLDIDEWQNRMRVRLLIRHQEPA